VETGIKDARARNAKLSDENGSGNVGHFDAFFKKSLILIIFNRLKKFIDSVRYRYDVKYMEKTILLRNLKFFGYGSENNFVKLFK